MNDCGMRLPFKRRAPEDYSAPGSRMQVADIVCEHMPTWRVPPPDPDTRTACRPPDTSSCMVLITALRSRRSIRFAAANRIA